ncbi:2-hydroxyacyl-CoA dehydratase [Dehalobacterium formicoaceticum]|uniref:2-hydroxyacyl-CoA dehydratase n=1 Tax=Dehalobacterium formicoaceticum TaxID=51515 RepID=UPI003B835E13
MAKYKVSFPQLGNYYVPLEVLFTEGLGVEYIIPPPITKRTLEIGSRYSPDSVCAPFKYTLGNFIETIEAGANTLVQAGGVCRLGYYGELDEQILRDLGYEVRFVNLAKAQISKPYTFYNYFKEINPDLSLNKIAQILPVALQMVQYIDEFEDYIRKNIGFEEEQGSFTSVHQDFLAELRQVRTKQELKKTYHKYGKYLKEIKVQIPQNPLRVGIVGEYYTIMEPFSNHYMEKELAQMGIVVDRWMNVTNSLLHRPQKKDKERIKHYAKYNMGATSMFTIDKALEFAKKGYDGIIHVKSSGCTPEIDAMPVLQNISADYKIPVLYFSFDSQTSDIGIQTRLEAFYDMIMMRKEN